jgi:hypothetical protein
MTISEFQQ